MSRLTIESMEWNSPPIFTFDLGTPLLSFHGVDCRTQSASVQFALKSASDAAVMVQNTLGTGLAEWLAGGATSAAFML